MSYNPAVTYLSDLRATLDRVFTARVILCVGFVLLLVYCYPGFMSYDSVWQLEQARGIEPRNEWQPPLMAWLWMWIDRIVAGPFPMLVIQNVAFTLGMWKLLSRLVSERRAAIITVVVMLYPPNLVVMAVIWKDCQMAGFLLAAIACLLSPKRHWRILGYVFIFLATGVRYNAAAATFAIVLGLFAWGVPMRRRKRYALATGLWLAITAAALVANGLVTERRMHPWQVAAAPLDIVGTIRYAGKLTDDEIREATPGLEWIPKEKLWNAVRRMYKPVNSYLETTTGESAVISPPQTEEARDAIQTAWQNLIVRHPGAFVLHRLAVFRAQLMTPTGGPYGFWAEFANADWGENILEHRAKHSAVQRFWIDHLVTYDKWFGVHVFAYFVWCIAFLVMVRRDRLAFVICLSGILHEIGLLLIAPAIDYRYSHWMVVCAILGGITCFVRRYRSGVTHAVASGVKLG